MPVSFLQGLSKDTGISVSTLERYWREAEKQATDKGLTDDSKYAYMTSIVKRRAGISENFKGFLDSKVGAKQFLEGLI
jgi:hypothetical protein